VLEGDASGAEAAAAPAPADGASGSSARSTSQQGAFRRSLFLRDGEGALCAVCAEGPVDAAHIMPRTTSTAVLLSAHLYDANMIENGILLCKACHLLHDAFMWHYLPARGIVVAEALLQEPERGGLWSARVGRQLTKPAAELQLKWWPPELVWETAFEGFTGAQAKRSARSLESPFFCPRCCWRGKTARGLEMHGCVARSAAGAQLSTPPAGRSGHGGYAGGGGGGGSSQGGQ
jgi:hypothetical protein